MRNSTSQPPRQRAARPLGLPFADLPGPDGAFWCGAIGAGAGIMVELAEHLDALSHSILQLPERTHGTRPAVRNYLSAVKSLARAWTERTRPALLDALGALAHAGTSLSHAYVLEAFANPGADGGKGATRVVCALRRRLALPASALHALAASYDALLDPMACVTSELEADTQLVSQRLQSDHVHAFLLSQQASALQSKLDDANLRQDAYWLQGPHCEHIRQEIALHSSALEGVRRQLDHLHAEQAALRAEGHILQKLMPSLALYLGAIERVSGALRATLSGTGAVLAELDELERTFPQGAHVAASAAADLRAALPQWRALAATAERLRPRDALRKRAGRRT
jgi:hypothetical protein